MANQFVQVRLFAVGGYPFVTFVTNQEYGNVHDYLDKWLSRRDSFLCLQHIKTWEKADLTWQMVIAPSGIIAYEFSGVDGGEPMVNMSFALIKTLQQD